MRRVPTEKLQQLALFTTALTGAGVGTMYYLIQSETAVKLTPRDETAVKLTPQRFWSSEYHQSALRSLESCSVAMETLGAPPLKVYNLHLTDRHNQVDQHQAQIKIPVKGSKSGGYLYTWSQRDSDNRWRLKQAVLKLREGHTIDLLDSERGS